MDKTCQGKTCDKPVLARGLCSGHYSRWRTTGEIGEEPLRKMGTQRGKCSIDGCNDPKKTKDLCSSHYSRLRTKGDPGAAKIHRRTPGPCTVEGCGRKKVGQDLCRMHYERKRKGKPVGESKPQRRKSGEGTINNGYRIHHINGKPQLEHRMKMEQLLGRPLLRSESVHHCNGDRSDNTTSGILDENYRSGNLELWSTWQPAGQRVTDKIAYAEELLRKYAPELLKDQ